MKEKNVPARRLKEIVGGGKATKRETQLIVEELAESRKLKRFAIYHHKTSCPRYATGTYQDCTCGLSALISGDWDCP